MTTAPSPPNLSVNSWNSLSKEERNKIVAKVQEENNKIKWEIDDHQKTLAELRQTVPENCRKMFEEEKRTLLEHMKTAELVPKVEKEGLSREEGQRMIANIQERVQAQLADQEMTKVINERTGELREENDNLRRKIQEISDELLAALQY